MLQCQVFISFIYYLCETNYIFRERRCCTSISNSAFGPVCPINHAMQVRCGMFKCPVIQFDCHGSNLLFQSQSRRTLFCQSEVNPFSLRMFHTFSGVMGISICRMPTWARASTTALTIACGDPTVGDSATPFAPIG